MRKLFLAALGSGSVIAGIGVARRYHRDLAAAQARLAALSRRVIPAASGAVEYAERGTGEPLLVIHGIFGGCDSGLLSAGDLFPDRRKIAPSRFGYLGSSLPAGATPADQADAYAALLDGLGIASTDVIAFSAGTASAVQFALRHPDRVKHLVVVSGSWPGSPTAATAPQANRLLVGSDFPLWAVKTFARPLMTRLIGVPEGLPLSAADERFVADLIESIFPVVPRADGVLFDMFVSNPDVDRYDLAAVTVPALLVHCRDDPLAAYDPARRAAGRIPGARLVSFDRGGHLGLGQQEATGTQIAAFLETAALEGSHTSPPSGPGHV